MGFQPRFSNTNSPSLRNVDYAMRPLQTASSPEPALFKNAATTNPPVPSVGATARQKKKGKSNLFYGG